MIKNSIIYDGKVIHRRFKPKEHYFRYNVFKQDLTGIFFNSFFEVNFFQILTNFSELLIIINEIFINKYFLFTLIFFFYFHFFK